VDVREDLNSHPSISVMILSNLLVG
jgi:hypothetical protein